MAICCLTAQPELCNIMTVFSLTLSYLLVSLPGLIVYHGTRSGLPSACGNKLPDRPCVMTILSDQLTQNSQLRASLYLTVCSLSTGPQLCTTFHACMQAAVQASATWDKFRKERDFHRMHHKRVGQEKNKLIHDMQILKKHYSMVHSALHSSATLDPCRTG